MSIDQKAVIKELAEVIAASATAHELSFDKTEAARGHKIVEDGGIFDFAQCYKLSLHQACVQEAGELSQVVYLLLSQAWNDTLEWVREQDV